MAIKKFMVGQHVIAEKGKAIVTAIKSNNRYKLEYPISGCNNIACFTDCINGRFIKIDRDYYKNRPF